MSVNVTEKSAHFSTATYVFRDW